LAETVQLYPRWGNIGFFVLSSVLLLATRTTDASKKRNFFLAKEKQIDIDVLERGYI
jgi:hypothetical protein